MLLGGLWHGASWNFVIWGAIHGALLALERAVGKRPPLRLDAARRCASRTTFALVLVTWVFFRAADLPAALAYLGRMFGVGAAGAGAPLLSGLLLQPVPGAQLRRRGGRRLGRRAELDLDARAHAAEDRARPRRSS